MSNKVTEFFRGAFEDMKESAKAQHEVDNLILSYLTYKC